MNNRNFGIAKAVVAGSVIDKFINEGSIVNTKNSVNDLAAIINQHPTLAAEMKIVESIERKTIKDDSMATRFIDKSINLMNNYKLNDIVEGYNAIAHFCGDDDVKKIEESKRRLYNAISSLIIESHKTTDTDIDVLHESFETVLSYIKEDKTNGDTTPTIEDLTEDIDFDFVIKKSVDKFNEKYASLNENQRDILNKLVYGDSKIKREIFESLKRENIEKLSSMDTEGVQDKISEAIEKLKNMEYTEENSIDYIIEMHDLKENLL